MIEKDKLEKVKKIWNDYNGLELTKTIQQLHQG